MLHLRAREESPPCPSSQARVERAERTERRSPPTGPATSRAASRRRRSSSRAPRARASRTSTGAATSTSPAGSAARTPATACRRSVAAMHEQIDRYLHQCFMVGMLRAVRRGCAAGSPSSRRARRRAAERCSSTRARRRSRTRSRSRAPRPAGPRSSSSTTRFHGRTLLTMTMTSKVVVQARASGRSRPRSTARRRRTRTAASRPTTRSPASSCCSRREVDPDEVACVVLEPVQGEGGFIPMPRGLPARLRELCARHGILYVDDEVQTGVGRTGPRLGDRALRRRARPARLRASRSAAACRSPRVTGRPRRSSTPSTRAGSAGRSAATPSRAPPRVAVLDEVADDRVPGARRASSAQTLRGAARRDRRARPGRSARSAASGRCSRSSSCASRHTKEPAPARASTVDRRSRARPDPAHVRPLRQRRPRSSSARRSRRGARPRPRHPGGGACRRLRAAASARPTSARPPTSARRRPQVATATSPRSTASTSRSRAASSSRCSARRGSGKTTTLRLIAGFERPDAGRILLGGDDVTAHAAVRARRQHGLPGLRALPAHDGRRERRVRAAR